MRDSPITQLKINMIKLSTIENQTTSWLVDQDLYDSERLGEIFKTPGTILLAWIEKSIYSYSVNMTFILPGLRTIEFDPESNTFNKLP
jgi:hypothetical protein